VRSRDARERLGVVGAHGFEQALGLLAQVLEARSGSFRIDMASSFREALVRRFKPKEIAFGASSKQVGLALSAGLEAPCRAERLWYHHARGGANHSSRPGCAAAHRALFPFSGCAILVV
jgi:hypothetical protein